MREGGWVGKCSYANIWIKPYLRNVRLKYNNYIHVGWVPLSSFVGLHIFYCNWTMTLALRSDVLDKKKKIQHSYSYNPKQRWYITQKWGILNKTIKEKRRRKRGSDRDGHRDRRASMNRCDPLLSVPPFRSCSTTLPFQFSDLSLISFKFKTLSSLLLFFFFNLKNEMKEEEKHPVSGQLPIASFLSVYAAFLPCPISLSHHIY